MEKMISGRGQLKIDGEPMEISFTVPAGLCGPEVLLPDVQRFASQVAEAASARAAKAGHPVTCAKGCGACCRQMVPVSPVEARHLARVVESLPAEHQARVRARFETARESIEKAGLPPRGDPDEDKEAYRAFGLAWFRAGVACPFLEEESCSIHPLRPLVCREYLVTSPPAGCALLGSGQVHQIRMPVHVWSVFSRSAAESGRLEWMPLIESLDYVRKNPELPVARTGPEHGNAFLEALRHSSGKGQ